MATLFIGNLSMAQKINLKVGESKTIQFTLSGKDLSFSDENGNTKLEAGKFGVFVGGNSKQTLNGTFELK